MTLMRRSSSNIQISVAMSLIWAPLLDKAVGNSTNSSLWREPYLDPSFLVIPVHQHFLLRSRYPRVEDTSHNSGKTLVHLDPLMSQIAQNIRGSCKERRAHCVHQVVNYIWRMCHPLQWLVVPLARPMNYLQMLGLVILPLMGLAMLMLQLLLSMSRTKTIVYSQNVVQWLWTMQLQGWICSL